MNLTVSYWSANEAERHLDVLPSRECKSSQTSSRTWMLSDKVLPVTCKLIRAFAIGRWRRRSERGCCGDVLLGLAENDLLPQRGPGAGAIRFRSCSDR